MSLLLVFGAGASYDALRDVDNDSKLPLARDLFSSAPTQHALKMKYDGMFAIEGELNDAFKRNPEIFDIEEELARLSGLASSRKNWDEILFRARFYIHDLIHVGTERINNLTHATNYSELLRLVNNWAELIDQKVLLVTFNYDLLLDQAMKEVLSWKSPVSESNDFEMYFSEERFKLYKVHGSINWWRKVMLSKAVAYTRQASVASYGQIMELRNNNFVVDPNSTEAMHAYLPAISLPLAQKQFTECPDVIMRDLDNELPEAEYMLIIGWRGADTHLVEKISKLTHLKKIFIANHSSGSNQVAKRSLEKLHVEFELFEGGFSSLIENGDINRILNTISEGK